MSTGARIRKCRTAAGLTQRQLAEAIGLTESAVRNYELGIRTPKKPQISAMAKVLGVAPTTLEELGVNSAREALEVVFRMEDELGLSPMSDGEGGIAVCVRHTAKGAKKAQVALAAWKDMRDDLDAGRITRDEYDAWKASFDA